ncbi:hypothetical protein HBI70_172220 [Parastagonospora nodorum]|nr:hypothetical protein HBH50_156640 [Parastagonospora nodorum]KAH4087536.1 hypothetical protein HBH48_133550 [Parastagonospora nodorum]KAH4605067.1 hypothetical protein HBH82_126010 [Parastagonospora nodorum]KAH4688609.1 hypothetical protein HBH78_102840 [Parastagonospora nodorum]KAH4707017.1 hypothetical protein HBH67_080820 [Parastagonospora nodorum]
MKFTSGSLMGLCLLGLKVTGVLSAALEANVNAGLARDVAANYAALEAECGDLGVMAVPEGTDPKDVRHCAEHPEGRNRYPSIDTSSDPEEPHKLNVVVRAPEAVSESGSVSAEELFGRDTLVCNSDKSPFNCSHGGYCWRECGWKNGPWCWLAGGNGSGPWMRCRQMRDCDYNRGGNCCVGAGSCGCDCRNK